MNAFDRAAEYGVMPVLTVPRVELALPLADALAEGGLPQIEIMFRSEAALESIKLVKKERPDMLVGAGTVLTTKQCDEANAAGADFIVTPGFNPTVVGHCIENGWDVLPGCVTPTEIENGMSFGLNTFKFFPSEKLGGVDTIKELCGPYSRVKFVPTSGITIENMTEYMRYEKIAAVGGGFMAPAEMIEAGDFASITALCRQCVKNSLGFTLAHVGVNGENAEDGINMAKRLAFLFDLDTKDGQKSAFAGTMVEFSKGGLPGTKGHIGIGTISVPRAMKFLERRGVKFREDYRHFDKNGNIDAAYIEEEIGGFAVHIVRKV